MTMLEFQTVYDEFLDSLVQKANPKEILAFHVPDTLQERADELTERNKQGILSSEEAAELERMLEFDDLVSLLKARALKTLK
jgi:hypothetical protein